MIGRQLSAGMGDYGRNNYKTFESWIIKGYCNGKSLILGNSLVEIYLWNVKRF